MKLIKGKVWIREDKKYKHTCYNCGTTFEFNDNDIRKTRHFKLNELMWITKLETVCPICGCIHSWDCNGFLEFCKI